MTVLLEAPLVDLDLVPVVVTAYGRPITQGSKKVKGRTKTGKVIMAESSDHLKPWRETVKTAALEAMRHRERLLGPVQVTARFYFDRPKGHYGTGRNAGVLKASADPFPMGLRDIDKLVRAILDAMTDAGVYRDDGQVVRLREVEKLWAGEPDGLAIPGVVIEVLPL